MNLRYSLLFAIGLVLAVNVEGQELAPLPAKVKKSLVGQQDSIALPDTSAGDVVVVYYSKMKPPEDRNNMPVKKLYGRDSANMPGTEKLAEIDQQEIDKIQKFTPKLLLEEKRVIKK